MNPLVAIVMGHKVEWEALQHCAAALDDFGIPHESTVLPPRLSRARVAAFGVDAAGRGIRVIVAGGSDASHLPGRIAAHTALPVIGVPLESPSQKGLDTLINMTRATEGAAVATVAIGQAGARNAALLAAAILALYDEEIQTRLDQFRQEQTHAVLASSDGLTPR